MKTRGRLSAGLIFPFLAGGCVDQYEDLGVTNKWRAPEVGFEDGVSTRSEILSALGPPGGHAFVYQASVSQSENRSRPLVGC